ncbi:MAG: iron-sulfur cluster assembly protein [Spirochaetes bacterium]|nr:iron-sulfur cluster assembly protein [Spirochaetota bacterium]
MESSKKPPLVSQVYEVLKQVEDPELAINIVDLGLVYHVVVQPNGRVDVDFTVTYPGCPAAQDIYDAIIEKIQTLEGVTEVSPHLVWDPPWRYSFMSEAARLELGYPI